MVGSPPPRWCPCAHRWQCRSCQVRGFLQADAAHLQCGWGSARETRVGSRGLPPGGRGVEGKGQSTLKLHGQVVDLALVLMRMRWFTLLRCFCYPCADSQSLKANCGGAFLFVQMSVKEDWIGLP